MTLYIPPKGLTFRLQNYKTNWAIYSRFSPDPQFFHYSPSDKYEDQYWTLIPGTGKHSGYYRIENSVTKWAIFSRFSPNPQFFHYSPSDEYDDQYWTFIPGSGKHANYFRIENFVTKWAIFSRFSSNPQFFHYSSSDEYDDQFWTFVFEDMVVESVDYKINEGITTSLTPHELFKQTIPNDTSVEQSFIFKVDESEKHTSTFGYSTGFTVTVGTEFKAGIPVIGNAGMCVEFSNTNTWTFGSSTETEKKYSAEFSVKAPSRKKIIAVASIKKAKLEVPYTMHLKSKKTGVKTETHGIYSGITTWDLTVSFKEESI